MERGRKTHRWNKRKRREEERVKKNCGEKGGGEGKWIGRKENTETRGQEKERQEKKGQKTKLTHRLQSVLRKKKHRNQRNVVASDRKQF